MENKGNLKLSRAVRVRAEVKLKKQIQSGLLELSKSEATDIQEMRRKIALDEFASRLCASGDFILKGAHALEIRSRILDELGRKARATQDLDLLLCIALPSVLLNPVDSEERLQQFIASRVTSACIKEPTENNVRENPGNLFAFEILEVKRPIEAQGGALGATLFCAAKLADQNFERFMVDIVVGDALWRKVDSLLVGHLMARVGGGTLINQQSVELISLEQHFAEKLHAYTMPRDNLNSRDKDLLDLVTLIDSNLDPAITANAVQYVFEFRATHAIPKQLEKPPESWKVRFEKRAAQCDLRETLDSALAKVEFFFYRMFSNL